MSTRHPRVVVPLDGSTHGEQALPWAVAVAGPQGHVQLVHAVHDADPAFFSTEAGDQLAKQSAQYLEQLAGRLGPGVGSTAIGVARGRPGPTVVDLARDAGADLIVLTSHGRGPLSRFWLGSTADYVMRRSAAPVLVIRPEEVVAGKAVLPHAAMILLDGSAEAERALRATDLLRLPHSTSLVLVRVLGTPYIPVPPVTFGAAPMAPDPTLVEREHRAAEDYLAAVADGLARRGYQNVIPKVLSSAAVGAAAVDLARELAIPLIVLSSHGRGGVGRLLMGSVADKVVRAGGPFVLVFARQDD
ncbi:MAG: universal stress protein [Gemmatimonadales bacterium]